MTAKISKSDLGWMAAVIDMKGHIIRKNNKMRATPQMLLLVDTVDRRIATRLSALTGTAPESRDLRSPAPFLRRGCKEHCVEPHVHVDDETSWRLNSTRWSLSGVAAVIVLSNLKPYMSTYAEYRGFIDQVMAGATLTGQGSGQVRASAQRLEGLGWRVPAKIAAKLSSPVLYAVDEMT